MSHLRPEPCPDDTIYQGVQHLFFSRGVKLLYGRDVPARGPWRHHFGETELFSPRERMVTVQAITFVTCLPQG